MRSWPLVAVLILLPLGSLLPNVAACTVAPPRASGEHFVWMVLKGNDTALEVDSGVDTGLSRASHCVNPGYSVSDPDPKPGFAGHYLAWRDSLYDVESKRVIVSPEGTPHVDTALPTISFGQSGRLSVLDGNEQAVEPFRLCAPATIPQVFVGNSWLAFRSAYGNEWFGHPMASGGLHGPWRAAGGAHPALLAGSLLGFSSNGTLDLTDGTVSNVRISAPISDGYRLVTQVRSTLPPDPTWNRTLLRFVPDPPIGILSTATPTVTVTRTITEWDAPSTTTWTPSLTAGTYTTTFQDRRYVVEGNQAVQHGPGAYSTTFMVDQTGGSHGAAWAGLVGTLSILGLVAIRRRLQ